MTRFLHGLSGLGLLLFFGGLVVIVQQCGCAPSHVRPAAYGTELTACTEQSKTCQESVACENRVRARYGRPERKVDCQ